jgi:hypothetical protein
VILSAWRRVILRLENWEVENFASETTLDYLYHNRGGCGNIGKVKKIIFVLQRFVRSIDQSNNSSSSDYLERINVKVKRRYFLPKSMPFAQPCGLFLVGILLLLITVCELKSVRKSSLLQFSIGPGLANIYFWFVHILAARPSFSLTTSLFFSVCSVGE